MIRVAVAGFFAVTLALAALALTTGVSLPVLVGFLFMANACLGLVIPTTMVMALDQHGAIAGLASSLGGTIQMLAGGLVITAASPFFDATATPMVLAILACATGSLVLTLALRRRIAAAALS